MAALGLGLVSAPASAWCDFVTGGGYIITTAKGSLSVHDPAMANFGVHGGCKNGSPTWGHLEYIDHGIGLNVHWTSITGYFEVDTQTGSKQPTGARLICGTARTNQFGDVDFVVEARDAGEPGINDQFDIRLRKAGVIVYDTTRQCFPHFLGSSAPCRPGTNGGGNIQLHKPNPSTSGPVGGGGSCPAL